MLERVGNTKIRKKKIRKKNTHTHKTKIKHNWQKLNIIKYIDIYISI